MEGDDRALSFRTRLLAEFRFDPIAVGVELSDSRMLLAGDRSERNTSLVNPLDVLQGYVSATLPNFISEGDVVRARLGRQTMDFGSRRLVARNRFRNTANTFTGLSVEWITQGSRFLRAFVTVPVERRINSPEESEIRFDLERMESVFWGASFGRRFSPGSLGSELNLFGIHERDSEGFFTSNRNFLTSGLRIYRNPRLGMFDFEIEALVQVGSSRLTFLPEDSTDLRHRAFFAHVSAGYTIASVWSPRIVVQYDYASGDADPTDGKNGRFDTLFGARRFEYGPTGLYGAFARSNFQSPGVRVEAQPHVKVEALLGYRAGWLAQARDRWMSTLLWDETGSSGTFLGHQLEGRLRWHAVERHITLETGFAFLALGEFPKNVPNGNPDAGDPVYLYLQISLRI